MKKYLKYILVSYLTAGFFEFIANTIGDGKLLQSPDWPIFFIVWYGFVYSVLYLLFRNRPVWVGVLIFAIFGVVAEIFIFHRSNLIIDFLIYGLMAYFPLKFYKKRLY